VVAIIITIMALEMKVPHGAGAAVRPASPPSNNPYQQPAHPDACG